MLSEVLAAVSCVDFGVLVRNWCVGAPYKPSSWQCLIVSSHRTLQVGCAGH
jgi:hypothetical protein